MFHVVPGMFRVHFCPKRVYLARVADDCPGVPGGEGGEGGSGLLHFYTKICHRKK